MAKKTRIKKIPQKVINRLLKASTNMFSETVESIFEDYPNLHKPMGDTVNEIIQRNMSEPGSLVGKNGKLEPLKRMFNLDDIAIELCFFIFCAINYQPVKQYFVHELECLEYENLPVLATMLGTDVEECLAQLETLSALGIVEINGSKCSLASGIDKFIKGIGTKNLKDMLCSPLGRSELEMEEFTSQWEFIG